MVTNQSQYDEMCKTYEEATNIKDVLKKIRADIEQLPTAIITETGRINISAYNFKDNVLMILDKYKL